MFVCPFAPSCRRLNVEPLLYSFFSGDRARLAAALVTPVLVLPLIVPYGVVIFGALLLLIGAL